MPQSERVLTTGRVSAERALMLNTGLLGVDGKELDEASITDIVPAQEDAIRGESGGSSFMRYAIKMEDQAQIPPSIYLYRTFGRSGTTIGKLRKGGTVYSAIPATLRQLQSVVRHRGWSVFVPAFIFRHGEIDASQETKPKRYGRAIEAIAESIAQDIRAITEQLTKARMLLCVLSAPNNSGKLTAITRVQIEAINRVGSQIVPSICPYWLNGDYGFISGQKVHWKPLAKALIAEYEARAFRILLEALTCNPEVRLGEPIKRRVFDGEIWKTDVVPFETAPRTDPSSIIREGNVITGQVFFAEGGLHIFTGFRPPARNHGFSWSGIEKIVSVVARNVGHRSWWKVELDGWTGRGGLLSYGETVSVGGPAVDAPGCYGDVFDHCREVSIATGLQLRSGMLPFWARIT